MLNFSNIDEVKKDKAVGEFVYLSSAFFLPEENKYAVFFNFKKFYEDNAYLFPFWDIIKEKMTFSFSIYFNGIPREVGKFEQTSYSDLYIAKFSNFKNGSEIGISHYDFDTFIAKFIIDNKKKDFREMAGRLLVSQLQNEEAELLELNYKLKRFYERNLWKLERIFLLDKFIFLKDEIDISERCQLSAFRDISKFNVSSRNISSLWLFDVFNISGDDRNKLKEGFAELQRNDCGNVENFDISISSKSSEVLSSMQPAQVLEERKNHYFLATKDGFYLPNSFFGTYGSPFEFDSSRKSIVSSDNKGFYITRT